MAALVRGDHSRMPPRQPRLLIARLAEAEPHPLALEFERRAIALDRDQGNALAGLLSHRERLQRATVDLHDGFVREQADDVDIDCAGAARHQQAGRDEGHALTAIHDDTWAKCIRCRNGCQRRSPWSGRRSLSVDVYTTPGSRCA